MTRESDTQTAVLRYLGCYPGVRVWRQGVVNVAGIIARIVRFVRVVAGDRLADKLDKFCGDQGFTRSVGLEGSGDVSGVDGRKCGRRIEIEVKSPTGRQSLQQKRFGAMITAHGGLYILVRSVEDCYAEFPPRERGADG